MRWASDKAQEIWSSKGDFLSRGDLERAIREVIEEAARRCEQRSVAAMGSGNCTYEYPNACNQCAQSIRAMLEDK